MSMSWQITQRIKLWLFFNYFITYIVRSTVVAWQKNFKVTYLVTVSLFSTFPYLTRKLICFSTCEDVVSFITNEYNARGVFTISALLFFSILKANFSLTIFENMSLKKVFKHSQDLKKKPSSVTINVQRISACKEG